MKVFEKEMSEEEIQKISEAYSKETSSSLFSFVLYISLLLLFNFYQTESGYYKYFFNIPVTILILNQLKKVIKLLFFNPIRKDLEQKKKIIISLIVSKKMKGYESFEGPNSSDSIQFQENPYFRNLDVSESSYYRTSIGNKVIFELSKYGKWIIAVHSNSKNIEYNTYNTRKSK